jgi:hypothetical protein
MRSLSELQETFAAFVSAPPERTPGHELHASVTPQGAPAEERLAIYKNNVYARLIEALAAAYPAVERLVGAEFFRYAAREYIGIFPARTPTLLGYGKQFPQFLARFAPAATVPYLADVAKLEQLYLESFHAQDAEPMSAAAFAATLADAENSSVALHPSARQITSTFAGSRIREVNRQPDSIEGRMRMPDGPEYLLTIRPRATVEVRRMTHGAYAILDRLAHGVSLNDALAAGAIAQPDMDLATHLKALADGETFCLKEARR